MQLNGLWYNELGSSMELQVNGNVVSGMYHTGVGEAQGSYPVKGLTDTHPLGQNQAVGFVVIWENKGGSSHSVTTWSGQLQMIDGQEVLTATWLLTHETDPELDWQSTLVGKDTFTRSQPSSVDIARSARRGGRSHPPRIN